jgi:hypothetical protein
VTAGFPILPGEDDAGNADLLALDFPARLFLGVTFRVKSAALLAPRAGDFSVQVAAFAAAGLAAHSHDAGGTRDRENNAQHVYGSPNQLLSVRRSTVGSP